MKPVSSVFSYFSVIILAVFLGFFVASCEKKSQPTESRPTQVEQNITEQNTTGAAEQDASATECASDCAEGDSVVVETTQTTEVSTDANSGDVVVTTTETITMSQESAENAENAEEAQPAESASDSAALPNAAIAALQKKGVVRIGVFGDKPPFGYICVLYTSDAADE